MMGPVLEASSGRISRLEERLWVQYGAVNTAPTTTLPISRPATCVASRDSRIHDGPKKHRTPGPLMLISRLDYEHDVMHRIFIAKFEI